MRSPLVQVHVVAILRNIRILRAFLPLLALAAAAVIALAPTAAAHHLRYDLTGANTFNGGVGTWTNHDGVTALTTAADLDDGLFAKNPTVGASFRMVLSNADAALGAGAVNSVEILLRQQIAGFVNDGFILEAYVGSGATIVAGPQSFTGSAAESLSTWDITSARAWTVSDLNQLEIRLTTQASGTTDGTWMVEQLLARVGINRAPTVGTASFTLLEDASYSGTITLSDPDAGDAPTLAIVGNGAKGTAAVTGASTGAFTYTASANLNGADSFTYRATDGGGLQSALGTASVTITPVNDEPSFTKGPDISALEDAGAHSIGNWATQISAGPNEASQSVVFQLTNTNNALFTGQPSIDSSGRLTFASAPNRHGAVTVSVTLKDNGGRTNGGDDTSPLQTFTLTITPVNDAPSLTLGPDPSTSEDSATVTVPGFVMSTDPGPFEAGQTFTFLVTTDSPAKFASGGAPSISPDGTLTFRPAPDANGVAGIQVRARDNGGTSNGGIDTSPPVSAQITINPVNDVPRPVADAYAATEDTPLVRPAPGVLGNDVELEGDPMTASLFDAPDHGGLVLNADGSFTYTPDADFNGVDTFQYRAADATGPGLPATVTITVAPVNDPPIALDGTHRGRESGTTTGSLLPFVADIDSSSFSFAITDDGLYGTAVITNAATGAFTYTVGANIIGGDRFFFTVSDGQFVSAAGRIDVLIGREVTTQEDRPFAGTMRSSFDGVGAVTYEITLAPRSGHVVVRDAALGTFTYVPDAHGLQTDEFEFRVLDGTGIRNAGLIIVRVQGETTDNPELDNDLDGFTNAIEWALGSDAERAHSIPINQRNPILNPGFEAGLLGWNVRNDAAGSAPSPSAESLNYYTTVFSGQDSGAAVQLINHVGGPDVRLTQLLNPSLPAGVATGGDFLLVDLVQVQGGTAYASACYGTEDCSSGEGADRVPLVLGQNRIRLADTAGAPLVAVSLHAPSGVLASATFDNVRIEGAVLAAVPFPGLALNHPFSSAITAELSFVDATASTPLLVSAQAVDAMGAPVSGYVCNVYDEARNLLLGGEYAVSPSTPSVLHFKAFCARTSQPTLVASGDANYVVP